MTPGGSSLEYNVEAGDWLRQTETRIAINCTFISLTTIHNDFHNSTRQASSACEGGGWPKFNSNHGFVACSFILHSVFNDVCFDMQRIGRKFVFTFQPSIFMDKSPFPSIDACPCCEQMKATFALCGAVSATLCDSPGNKVI